MNDKFGVPALTDHIRACIKTTRGRPDPIIKGQMIPRRNNHLNESYQYTPNYPISSQSMSYSIPPMMPPRPPMGPPYLPSGPPMGRPPRTPPYVQPHPPWGRPTMPPPMAQSHPPIAPPQLPYGTPMMPMNYFNPWTWNPYDNQMNYPPNKQRR